jgi:threonine dehydrogenase-like Zn-dependent dehydrogenase
MADLKLTDHAGPDTQRVAVLESPFRMTVRNAWIPEPGEGEIRIKVHWVGICGSDLEAYRGTRAPEFISTPSRLGHEVAGVIDKLGRGVAGLKTGGRVACRYVWGAFAEYIVCNPFNVALMPDDFPMKEISLAEILPGVLHAAELGQISASKTVLIMGQGVSGLVLTQAVSLFSPKSLVVTDLNPRKLALARKYGATHAYQMPSPDTATRDVLGSDFPGGFDVVIPCLLEGDGMIDAIECCAPGAKIVMYGCIGVCRKPIDFFKVHRKRLEIFSTEPRRDIDMRRLFEEGLALVRGGMINTGEIVTHTLPLERIQEAFELRNNPSGDVIHVLVGCRRGEDS